MENNSRISLKHIIFFSTLVITIIILFFIFVLGTKETPSNYSTMSAFKDVGQFNKKLTDLNDIREADSGYFMCIRDINGSIIKENTIVANDDKDLYITIINANKYKARIGFELFLNGKVQPFYVDNHNNTTKLYSTDIDKCSYINLPISLKNLQANNNGVSSIYFTLLTDLNKKPKITAPIPFFLFTIEKTMKFLNYKDRVESDVQSNNCKIVEIKESMQKSIKKNYLTSSLKKIDDTECINLNATPEQDLHLKLECLGLGGLYSTIVFLDNNPVKVFNNNENLIWGINTDQMLSQDITINVPKIEGEHLLYAITIPLSGEDKSMYNTQKYILNVKKQE